MIEKDIDGIRRKIIELKRHILVSSATAPLCSKKYHESSMILNKPEHDVMY